MKSQGSQWVRFSRFGCWLGVMLFVAGAALSVPSARGSVVGYWNFNQGSGATLTDLSLNADSASFNGPTWTASGGGHTGAAGDYALNFGGVVDIPASTALQIGSATNKNFTISLWVQDNYSLNP